MRSNGTLTLSQESRDYQWYFDHSSRVGRFLRHCDNQWSPWLVKEVAEEANQMYQECPEHVFNFLARQAYT